MSQSHNISKLDRKFLFKTIRIAEKAYNKGNYPVGAIIAINNKELAHQENQVVTKNSWAHHAENQLIISNGEKIRKAASKEDKITLYSSLEPCLMCIGAATMSKVTRIVYIQKDPHGGAGNLDISNLGARYPDIYPDIIEARISDRPHKLIIKFLEKYLKPENKEWVENALLLFRNA